MTKKGVRARACARRTSELRAPSGHFDVYGWERGFLAVVLPDEDRARVRARLTPCSSGDRAHALRFVADAAYLPLVSEQREEYVAGTRRDIALDLDPLGTPSSAMIGDSWLRSRTGRP